MKKDIILILSIFLNIVFVFHSIQKINNRLIYARALKVSLEIQKLTKEVRQFKDKVQELEDRYIYIPVTITAYNATKEQCDSTPFITASGQRVQHGIIALSRDLEKNYGLLFGDKISLLGIGSFEFQDRMGLYSKKLKKRIKKSVDIFMWDKEKTKQFGRQKGHLIIDLERNV